ncbi:unnamed protein product [Choristocarpus tenellus]
MSTESVAVGTLSFFFFLAAYLNLNDPDPELWCSFYVVAATICIGTAVNRSRKVRAIEGAAMLHGLACLSLALYTMASPSSIALSTTDDILEAEEMVWITLLKSESAREGGGALIMVFAMVFCARVKGGDEVNSNKSRGRHLLAIVGVVVAVAATLLGIFVPGYLLRAGAAVPEHCTGSIGGIGG